MSQPYPPDPLISPDYSGWWQRAVAVVKLSWRQLLALQAIVAVLIFAVQGTAGVAAAFAARDLDDAADAGDDLPLGTFFAAFGLGIAAAVFGLLVSTAVTIAAVRIVVLAATGGQPRVVDALGAAARRVFPLIGWSILAGIIGLAALCACILPVFYIGAVFTVLAPVVALERGNAISRCFKLFHGDLAVSIGRIATIGGIGIGAAVVAAAVDFIGDAVVRPESASTAAVVAATVFATAVSVFLTGGIRILTDPLTVAAYADMRARVEPLSSAVLAYEAATR
jgi:hypothetical protein